MSFHPCFGLLTPEAPSGGQGALVRLILVVPNCLESEGRRVPTGEGEMRSQFTTSPYHPPARFLGRTDALSNLK